MDFFLERFVILALQWKFSTTEFVPFKPFYILVPKNVTADHQTRKFSIFNTGKASLVSSFRKRISSVWQCIYL